MTPPGSSGSRPTARRRRARPRRTAHAALCSALAAGLALAALPAIAALPQTTTDASASPADRERARSARRLLQDARRLEQEGRLQAAERTTERALALTPEDPRLHRLRARLLAALGRGEAAEVHRAAAERLDPAPALPADAISADGARLLVILLAPPADSRRRGRAPADWPEGEVHAALVDRLAQRLPGARVEAAPDDPSGTVASRRAWIEARGRPAPLSLRVDRAFCGESVKDGRFALALLRVGLPEGVYHARFLRDDPALGAGCRARAVAHALEEVWTLPALAAAHGGTDAAETAQRLDGAAIHALFPDLEERIEEALLEGRRWLAAGQLDAARSAFLRAYEIDPDHVDARSFLVEVDRTLEISRQLSSADGDPSAAHDAAPDETAAWRRLEPRLSPAERAALEAQLEAEQRLRDDLLATLALIGSPARAPDPTALAGLREGTLPAADAKGPRRARAQLQPPNSPHDETPAAALVLRTRVVHTPTGELLARYYFVADDDRPVLMEEDTRGDGRLDRWVAWRGGRRREIWEEDRGAGLPDLHLVYASDGLDLERVELGGQDGRRPQHVFVYREGVLRGEFRDTTDDGRFDEILHFEPDGTLALREQDLDHDGQIDVRTAYRSGRMVRREIMNPDVVAERP